MRKYHAEQYKGYRDRKRVLVTEYLKEHQCVDCGEADIRALDFDHLDPSTKKRNVSRMAIGEHTSWAVVLVEIEKCVVRCANCHRKKTIGEPEWFADPEGFKAKVEATKVRVEATKVRKAEEAVRCGTRRAYQRGCRCPPCTTAQREYMRKLRANH